MDARHKLIDLAAFLDRVDRHEGEPDYRLDGFHDAVEAMLSPGDIPRAQAVLEALSDHTTKPIPKATIQGAFGAVNRESGDGRQASGN
ncbi:MAG: hypothetical protein KJO79_07490 [Verrucomicrobiae bacterium]|nr:hypothetical protein [Verrucomicrobiae bacterium]NNJ87006.1 hypothetical protein [Akkermansiaceae bacterium]